MINNKMNKSLLMSYDQDQKKNKFVHSILNSFSLEGIASPSLFLEFAQWVLNHVPIQDLVQGTAERWFLVVESLWHKIQEAPAQYTQPVLTYQLFPFLKGEGKRTVIQLVNKDRPFLLDSTLAELKRHHLIPTFILHPVLGIERDKKGHLSQIKKRGQFSYKGSYESLIHIELVEHLSPDQVSALHLSLSQVMKNVADAVADWPPMQEKLLFQKTAPLSSEEKAFLTWINEDHWTFLGYRHYTIEETSSEPTKYSLTLKESFGIFRSEEKSQSRLYGSALKPEFLTLKSSLKIRYSKITTESLVHKSELIDLIEISHFDSFNKPVALSQFFGLFTSSAYRASAGQVPILRQKIKTIFTKLDLLSDWHDGKKWLRFLDDFPRDELLSLPEDRLFSFSTAVLEAQEHHTSKILLRLDPFRQFLSCVIYLPQEDYSSEVMEKAIFTCEKEIEGKVTSCHMRLGDSPYAWIHLIISLPVDTLTETSLRSFERKLLKSLETWNQALKKEICDSWGEEEGHYIWSLYDNAFEVGYQKRFSPIQARDHILLIQSLGSHSLEKKVIFHLEPHEDPLKLKLQIFTLDHPVPLSTILPILENLGAQVRSENPFSISLKEKNTVVSLQELEILTMTTHSVDFSKIKQPFLEGLNGIWEKRVENDGFNKLILLAGLTYRECEVFRAYSDYMRQMNIPFSLEYIQETILKNPRMVNFLIQVFHNRFNLSKGKVSKTLLAAIKKELKATQSTDEDRILGLFLKLIMATVRTNYYQTQENHLPKSYLSFKLEAGKLEELPLPRPLYEIFVYASFMKAVHLRGNMVARGGIRWSDRKEDFRTEVLGLMKAQMTKNAVIVPAGSKGGFVLKGVPETREKAIEAYQVMLRGMLDLTDNIVRGQIMPPPQVRRYDGDDTYLVVAADKGTATFSDIANKISEEYGFWLGDAFASGGSSGYDHKKMGITSRGAWESVKRHFHLLGESSFQKPFQVVAVGDMSGDVFGNGMLLSEKIKLIGAFNHLHIFVDPTPDPAVSYEERKRLFALPTSTWMDYNPELLSKGGRLFSRQEKSLKLTKEIKHLLGIHRDEVTPNDLIRQLLLFPADLLWFGGIGTFVKSGKETHLDVGDRANDYLRVDGSQLKCKVLVEGANLGVTQQGRIEYALKGGQINTDFVDNSAGVDCSDHEVNIKILLNPLLGEGKLTLEERNTLLGQMNEEVSRLVLQDNYFQNMALQVASSQSQELMEDHLRLIRELESSGRLSRALEYLPEDEVIRQGRLAGKSGKKYGLTTPELAMLMAYVKNDLQEKMKDQVQLGEVFEKDFLNYFPQKIQDRFPEELKKHLLKPQIISTVITNLLINRVGLTFIQDVKTQRPEATLNQIIHSFMLVRYLFNLDDIWSLIDQQDSHLDLQIQTCLFIEVGDFVRQACADALFHEDLLWEGLKESTLPPSSQLLKKQIFSLLEEGKKGGSKDESRPFIKKQLPEKLTESLSLLKIFSHPFQVLGLAQLKERIPSTVVKTYFKVEEDFKLKWLRHQARLIPIENLWQQQTICQHMELLLEYEGRWCTYVLEASEEALRTSYEEKVSLFRDLLAQLKESSSFDITLLGVAVNRLGKLLPPSFSESAFQK